MCVFFLICLLLLNVVIYVVAYMISLFLFVAEFYPMNIPQLVYPLIR